MTEHHKCARCGVADAKVRCYNERYVHEYAADCFAQNDDQLAALKRDNAQKQQEIDRLRAAIREKEALELAALQELDEVRAAIPRVAVEFAKWWHNHGPHVYPEGGFAAFRKSDAYPKGGT